MNGTDKKHCADQSRDQDEQLDGAITQSNHRKLLVITAFQLH
jgi:hypothetical protein